MYAGDGEPIEGRTRLQKMVFLMQQKLEERDQDPLESDDYEFIPYDYGPFAKELYSDLESLSHHEMIRSSESSLGSGKTKYDYEIKNAGEDFVSDQIPQEDAQIILDLAEEIKSEYNKMILSDLIDDVYSQYPEYAENSIY